MKRKKLWNYGKRICSMILVIVMLINLLPAESLSAEEVTQETPLASEQQTDTEEISVLGEVTENRTKFSKEFRMSNGLHMTSIYAGAVHYEENGEWKEIDNTLRLENKASGDFYINTAGRWQVSFPQNMTKEKGVTITKDGYELSFYLDGELYHTGQEIVDEAQEAEHETEETTLEASIEIPPNEMQIAGDVYRLEPIRNASATVEAIDMTEIRDMERYDEIISDKTVSRLRYSSIYENTDIVYDIDSARVKESIVMEKYNANLGGYRYILDVGEMIPRLTESNKIELYDAKEQKIVMVMPRPYLVDDAGEHCFEVDVTLQEVNGKYILTYTLPKEWLADEERV